MATTTLATGPYGDADINPQTNPVSSFAWATNLVFLVLYAPCYTMQVFLRRKFGCRYLRLWMILACDLLLWTVYNVGSYGGWPGLDFRPTPARVFAAIMTALAIYHSKGAWRDFWGAAKHPDRLWHSMSDGVSHLRAVLPESLVSDWMLRIAIEPLIIALCALACVSISAIGEPGYFRSRFLGLGLWLLMSALFYCLLEGMLYEQRLHKYVDMVDQNIEAISMQKMQDSYMLAETEPLSPEQLLGNPVIYNPKLFNVMQTARAQARSAKHHTAAAS